MVDETAVDYKDITNRIFIPALKKIGFRVKSKTKRDVIFFYNGNESHEFLLEKDTTENAVCFHFWKLHTGDIPYSLRNIILVVCDEPYKSMHVNAPEKYYYDTAEELIGIYDFVYGVIIKAAYDFYYGDLADRIKEDILIRKKKGEKENKDETEEFKRIFQYIMDWEKVRFIERRYL
jgi:hypothetical protein